MCTRKSVTYLMVERNSKILEVQFHEIREENIQEKESRNKKVKK